MLLQLTVMVNTSVASMAEVEAVRERLALMDWVGLREVTQGGEDSEAFVDGGCNLVSLRYRATDSDPWKED
jgi:glycine cleavage system aminomethyltransferase T